MSVFNGLQVRNLRSLIDTQKLKVKPLNILVGRNSGGKSTYARIFPLLRQSVEVRKSSPILWYGRLVDFGSFIDSVRDSNQEREIEFTFDLVIDGKHQDPETWERSTYEISASISLKHDATSKNTVVTQVKFTFANVPCLLNFSGGKLKSARVGNLVRKVPVEVTQTLRFLGLFPSIDMFNLAEIMVEGKPRKVQRRYDFFGEPLKKEIGRIVKDPAFDDILDDIAEKFSFGTDEEILLDLRGQTEGPTKWIKFCENIQLSSSKFPSLKNKLLFSSLPALITAIDEAVSSFAKRTSYIEPLRATAQRYYRRQELAVDELDSRGENLPFFLDNITGAQKLSLDRWLKAHFGIALETQRDGGHIAIRLKISEKSKPVNLADTGFGFSQVLPIALQLWRLSEGIRFGVGTNSLRFLRNLHSQRHVVIEQPELHLHPALQGKLADIFTACLDNKSFGMGLNITVETHSPTLINRIGELIATNRLDADKVQVILFEKNELTGISEVKVSEFNSDGVLMNWPYGFFDSLESD